MAKIENIIPFLQENLLKWYKAAFRPLPWRASRDPYRIWISEVMLQQTTVQAVLPYYENFIKKFPQLEDLAKAPIEEIYILWAGLGYYSRARNLYKSAQIMAQSGFPKTAEELIELPGFGPYTSRAVSSLAFDEKVGVLDGNVIRILTRVFGFKTEWWKTNERKILQHISDQLADCNEPHLLNQGMMELGATICTPKNPSCPICPWQKKCVAREKKLTQEIPLSKPKEVFEHWEWQPQLFFKNKKLALIENQTAPFLKNHWIFPGKFVQLKKKPRDYDFRHNITKYNIYVRLDSKSLPQFSTGNSARKTQTKWAAPEDIKKVNPSSLLQKILTQAGKLGLLTCLFALNFFLNSCANKSVPSGQVAIPNPLLSVGARPLTFIGENNEPRFNPSGDRIVFASRNRPQHSNSQIYELNFQKVSERRVTFQDGDVSYPSYYKQNKIIYGSTTDEIKESLITREELSQNKNRLEIYSSDLFGNDILRWTKSPGLDTQPSSSTRDSDIYFISESRHPAGIYFLKSNEEAPRLYQPQGKNTLVRAQINPNGNEVVWIEKDSFNKNHSLRLKNNLKSNIQEIYVTQGELQNASWGPEPDQWLISEKSEPTKEHRILLYDSKNQCTQVILSITGWNALDPVINNNNPRLLVFTLQKDTSSQIYMMEWPKDRGPCLESKKQDKIKE